MANDDETWAEFNETRDSVDTCMVNPLILGGGKALFKDVKERHGLRLVRVQPLKSGMVSLTYSTL
jgi:hypothetical protein